MTLIFVFGSNTAGIHGAGSALHARKHFGAQAGVGYGPTGHAYAIPTKDRALQTLPLDIIAGHVGVFLDHARIHSDDTFEIVKIGCGLAGYRDHDIGPMFKGAPSNCQLPLDWERYR